MLIQMFICDLKGDEDVVLALLAAKADVNITDLFGDTALMWADKTRNLKLCLEHISEPAIQEAH